MDITTVYRISHSGSYNVTLISNSKDECNRLLYFILICEVCTIRRGEGEDDPCQMAQRGISIHTRTQSRCSALDEWKKERKM
jgi:hypothetical protein